MLEATVGSSILLAGCNGQSGGTATQGQSDGADSQDGDGGDGGSNTDSDTTGSGGNSDATYTFRDVTGAQAFTNAHLNAPWGPPGSVARHCCQFGAYIFDSLVGVSIKNGRTIPYMVSDWDVDGTDMYVELDDRWEWHNGDQYTTESIKIAYDINWAINEHRGTENVDAQFIEDYEKINDTRMEFSLKDSWNKVWLAEATLTLNSHYHYHPDTWGEWRDRALDTEPGTDEFDAFLDDLSEFTPTAQAGEEWLGYGPWQVDNINSSRLEMSVYDGHPWSDHISTDRVVLKGLQEGVGQSAWLNGDIDVWRNYPLPEGVAQQAPSIEKFNTSKVDWEIMGMNNRLDSGTRRPTNYRPIRHAIAFALDFQSIADNLGKGWETYPIPQSHISGLEVEQGRYDFSNFVDHSGQQTERARELINATSDYTGYVFEDGRVYDDEEGIQAPLDLFETSGTGYAPAMRTMRDQLNSFGFDVTLDFVEGATYGQRRSEGEFDLYPDGSGMGPTLDRWKIGRMGPQSGYRNRWGFSSEWASPEPIGEPDLTTPRSELPTINIDDIMQGMLADSVEEVTRKGRQLAWAWNQKLPAFIAVQLRKFNGVRSPPWNFTFDDQGVSPEKASAVYNDADKLWHHAARLGYLRHEDDSGSGVDLPEFGP